MAARTNRSCAPTLHHYVDGPKRTPEQQATERRNGGAATEPQAHCHPAEPGRVAPGESDCNLLGIDGEGGDRRYCERSAERHRKGRGDARPIETGGIGED